MNWWLAMYNNAYTFWVYPNGCNSDHNLDHDILHEGGDQKARSKLGFVCTKTLKIKLAQNVNTAVRSDKSLPMCLTAVRSDKRYFTVIYCTYLLLTFVDHVTYVFAHRSCHFLIYHALSIFPIELRSRISSCHGAFLFVCEVCRIWPDFWWTNPKTASWSLTWTVCRVNVWPCSTTSSGPRVFLNLMLSWWVMRK